MMSFNNDFEDFHDVLSEDSDSGLVEDAFDVLPDENTLALDLELELDLSEENFGRCSTSEFSDLLELDTSAADIDDNVFSSADSPHKDLFSLPVIENTLTNTGMSCSSSDPQQQMMSMSSEPECLNNNERSSYNKKESNGKLISFTKDQARQWRRKRILNSSQKKVPTLQKDGKIISSKPCPTQLEPLLPLPKNLKPVASKHSSSLKNISLSKTEVTPEDKLANPLLGGERLGTKTRRGKIYVALREQIFLGI